MAGKFPNFFFQPAYFCFHHLRHGIERFGIDANPGTLHIGEHWRERQIDFCVYVSDLFGTNLRL